MSSTTQSELEQSLSQMVQDGKIPHAAVYATNKDGSFTYSYQTGIDGSIKEEPVFMLASQTKLLTSISALQAVEKGIFTLDEDVSGVLPEIGKNGVLTADGTIEPLKKAITVRQLLSHSSGASYPQFHPGVIKHLGAKGVDAMKMGILPTITERFDAPMVAQPGEGWMYSPGLDWIGVLLQRKTNGKYDLESWMREHLWGVLGIDKGEATFWPDENMKSRIPELNVRTAEGELVKNTNPTINTLSTECFGGHGVYSTLPAYLKILHSLLANDGKLVSPAMLEEMKKPQLGEASKVAFNKFLHTVSDTMMPGEFNKNIPVSYGLGGMVFLETDHERKFRVKGSMSWSGLFNCFWVLDWEAGVA